MAIAAVIAPTVVGAAAVPATRTTHVQARIRSAATPLYDVAGFGSVWVDAEGDRTVVERINPATNRIVASIHLGLGGVGGDSPLPEPLAIGAGSVWVTDYFRNLVDRINPTTNRVVERLHTGRSPSGVVVAAGRAFVANGNDGTVVRINPRTGRIDKTLHLGGPGPGGFGNTYPQPAAFAGSVWVAVPSRHEVDRINPKTAKVSARYDVSKTPGCGAVLPAPGGFWLASTSCANEINRYSITRRKVVATYAPTDSCLTQAMVAGGHLYLAESTLNRAAGTCGPGYVVKRDLRTGASVAQVRVSPTMVYGLAVADGSIWTDDVNNTTIRLARF